MRRLLLVSILPFFYSYSLFADANPAKGPLEKKVCEYYQSIDALSNADATQNDIDTIINQFTRDFVYEHPKYGGIYSREQLYSGFQANFKRGAHKNNKPASLQMYHH